MRIEKGRGIGRILMNYNPDTPWDCHRTADQLGWAMRGQLIGMYGSPMECLGKELFGDPWTSDECFFSSMIRLEFD